MALSSLAKNSGNSMQRPSKDAPCGDERRASLKAAFPLSLETKEGNEKKDTSEREIEKLTGADQTKN